MMRLPAPVILAALIAVAAGTVVLNVSPNKLYYEINVTGFNLNEGRLYYLDFVPDKIYLTGDPSHQYCVTVYVTNALLEGEDGRAASYATYCDIGDGVFGEFRVLSVWGPVNATVRVVRIS
jgi:hypothetical protein